MNDILNYANHYYNLGLNITCICRYLNENNLYYKNLLKSPIHKWKHLIEIRQSNYELESYDWSNSVGVGSVTGYNDLRVIDIDGCTDINFLNCLLDKLGLPYDYEWIVVSGSNDGFHIFYYSDKFSYLKNNQNVTTFPPKIEYEKFVKKIEFLWETHVVLPPSLHISGNKYRFLNCIKPISLPLTINKNRISKLISEYLVTNKVSILTDYGVELVEFKPPLTLTDFLKNQISEHGIEILDQKQRIKAILSDLLPTEKKIQYLLELSLRNCIPQKLFSILSKERSQWISEIKSAKKYFKDDFFLEDKTVNSVFDCWIEVLLSVKRNN
jgi:hypothetical protein